jgi:thiol:disulfide interchange protein
MNGLMKVAVFASALSFGLGAHAQELKKPAHPYTKRHLYDEQADPNALIAAGLKQAKAEHKRVVLDFGGDWCGDCQVLDIYLHEAPNEEIADKHFIFVHIFVPSDYSSHGEVAAKYGVPIEKGVPALAVLDANGKVLHSQKTGEFNDMRHMDAAALTEFLNHWKG